MKPIKDIKSVRAVLAIMMGAGAIVDFELLQFGIRIWPPQDGFDQHLSKQIAALLPHELDERHITIVKLGAS
jgi:hypothetical protein